MTQKKPSLGRGLNALMGSIEAPQPAPLSPTPALLAAAPVAVPTGDRLARLPLDILQRGRYQPRSHMDPEALNDLAASIRTQGVVQPIVVRPIEATTPTGGQRYEIIAVNGVGAPRSWRNSPTSRRSCATCRTRRPSRSRSSRTSSART